MADCNKCPLLIGNKEILEIEAQAHKLSEGDEKTALLEKAVKMRVELVTKGGLCTNPTVVKISRKRHSNAQVLPAEESCNQVANAT